MLRCRVARAPSALAILLFASFAASPASAAGRPLDEAITVDPGATCVERGALLEQVRAWLGDGTVDADVNVDVRGSPDQPRVVSFRTLRDGRVVSQRRFQPGPERCDHMHAALGLAIAMALDASLVLGLAPQAEATPPTPAAPAVPAALPAPPNADAPAAPPPPPAPWAVGGDAVAAFSVLPDPAYGAAARVERTIAPVVTARAGLEGLGSFGERFAGAAGYFDTQVIAARVDVCAALPVARRVSAGACMGVLGGLLHTEGYGYPGAQGAFEGWLAIANELRAELEVSPRWSFGLAGALLLPVGRNSIVLRTHEGQVQSSRDLPGMGWSIALGPVRRF